MYYRTGRKNRIGERVTLFGYQPGQVVDFLEIPGAVHGYLEHQHSFDHVIDDSQDLFFVS